MGTEFTVGALTKNFRFGFFNGFGSLLPPLRQFLTDIENEDNLFVIKGYSQLYRQCRNHVR